MCLHVLTLDKIKAGFVSILMHIYDVNYKEILKVDPNEISYEDLYKNDFIKTEFKEFLVKLDELCLLENMLKDRNSYILTEICWTIFSSTDMIVLSTFVSTQISSVYGIYNMIFSNII